MVLVINQNLWFFVKCFDLNNGLYNDHIMAALNPTNTEQSKLFKF